MSNCSRCTGHCCKEVILPLSPVALRKGVIQKQKYNEHDNVNEENPYSFFTDQTGRKWTNIQDIEQIQKIFKLIKISEFNPSNNQKEGTQLNPLYIYTCSNLDKEGNCTDYQNRPQLCRKYPYGRKCEYSGCTYKEEEIDIGDVEEVKH